MKHQKSIEKIPRRIRPTGFPSWLTGRTLRRSGILLTWGTSPRLRPAGVFALYRRAGRPKRPPRPAKGPPVRGAKRRH